MHLLAKVLSCHCHIMCLIYISEKSSSSILRKRKAKPETLGGTKKQQKESGLPFVKLIICMFMYDIFIYLNTTVHKFGVCKISSSKDQHLKIEIFSSINVFTVTFNVSLLEKNKTFCPKTFER